MLPAIQKCKETFKSKNPVRENDHGFWQFALDECSGLNYISFRQFVMFAKKITTILHPENEKLKMLSAKVTEENKVSKQLIVQLLKENEKIKLEKGRLIKEQSWEEFRSFVVLEVETDMYDAQNFCFQSKGKKFYFGSFLNEDDKLILKNELKQIIAKLNALSPGL